MTLIIFRKFYYSLHFIALGAMLIPEKTKHSTVRKVSSHVLEIQHKTSVSNTTEVTVTNRDVPQEFNGKLKMS